MIRAALITVSLISLTLAACGRPAQVVVTKRSTDTVMSCFQLSSEYQANLDAIGFNQIESLARERSNLGSIANVLVEGVGALAAIDSGSAGEAELDGYMARNRRIAEVSEQKQCPPLAPDMDEVKRGLAASEAAPVSLPPKRTDAQ